MLDTQGNLVIALRQQQKFCLNPRMINRHGLITGATGTGKTVTLQTLAEGLSGLGVPVFITDIKGDLSGLALAGEDGRNAKVDQRIKELQLVDQGYHHHPTPVCFWDVFGQQGHPLRITVSELGALLLSRLLDLNETQTGVLSLVFRIADDQGLLLLDFKDLSKILEYVSQNRNSLSGTYGNLASASLGAIQRSLLQLEDQGANRLFGEPALRLGDMMTTIGGRGLVNILAADQLMMNPRIYATILLWLLSELFEQLPECGDPDKPKMVFFFDEAHLLFSEAPKVLLEKVEQVVRLIRSKGVGVYFITQSPTDVPDKVLAQLSNKVQHALRAHTEKEQKGLRAAALSFRANPSFNTQTVLSELAVGEALVSFLDNEGIPAMVERAWVAPPEGRVGPLSIEERQAMLARSPVVGIYEKELDRESAFEILSKRLSSEYLPLPSQTSPTPPKRQASRRSAPSQSGMDWSGQIGMGGVLEDLARKTGRSLVNEVSRKIARGLLGTILGGRSR